MAGETDAERPLILPVSPFGALILALHPFDAGLLPLTLRLPLSRGAPLISAPDPRLSVALWPGGVIETELIPEKLPEPARLVGQSAGLRFFYRDGLSPVLLCEGPAERVFPLPGGARPPVLSELPGALLLTGSTSGGEQYALILRPDVSAPLLSVTGQNITLLENGAALRVTRSFSDSVGHAALETWAPSPSGWTLASSEPIWEHGSPIRPVTPEATAVAAIEAAQLGLLQEAESYFAPACPHAESLTRAAAFDGCTPLRYALPSGEAAVGLMKLKDNVLHIVPTRYAAQPGGGAYLLTRLEIDENSQT